MRTRDTSALATSAWILTTVAFTTWTTYGVLQCEWPIIAPNALCFVLAGFILTLKLLSRRRDAGITAALLPRRATVARRRSASSSRAAA